MKTYTIYSKTNNKILWLITILLLVLCQKISAQHTENSHDHQGKCVSDEDRAIIDKQISESRARLKAQGKLNHLKSNTAVSFSWPLSVKEELEYNNYYYILGHVDQDSGSGKEDYNCGNRTYNGHKGTDIMTWPFPWYIYDNDYVEVVAAAPGTILTKRNGNSDQNCSWTGSWNAVYVEHDDGSIAWYGHLKKNSLTDKDEGDRVARGEYLGLVASSGQSTNPHLHFEVYDKNSKLIDPFSGDCNDLNDDSWWASQKDYRVPTLNALLTHSAEPDHRKCKYQEKPYLSNQFSPGKTVYVGAYFSDYLWGDESNYRMKRPDGTVWDSWTYTSNLGAQSKFQRVYPKYIPYNEAQGMWTVEVDYRGKTFSHRFYYGSGCPPKNLKPYEILPFATESGQDLGTANLQDQNTTIKLQNNAWKAIEVDYNITSNTVISFDFKSTIGGEIHGLGFANNTTEYNRDKTFRLYGTQSWGDDSFYDYRGDNGYQRFVIPVGEFYTGQFKYLFFLCDNDVPPYSSNSHFSNIKIFEDGNRDGICGSERGSGCATLDFDNYNINSYGGSGQDYIGTASVIDNGSTLKLNNNAWKSIDVNYNVTPKTVMSFYFKTTAEREIHTIGFDDNSVLSPNVSFRIAGEQNWGIDNFDVYVRDGAYQKYVIPVGQFYTGWFKHLFFGNDNDASPHDGNSYFSKIKIYEDDNSGVDCYGAGGNKEGLSNIPDIQLYPNPATNIINVKYELSENTTANIMVFDAFGKLVKNVPNVELLAGNQTLDMNVSDLSAGMYFYTLQASEWKATKKFIIVK